MTYWNPITQYGVDRFADDLLAAGGAGRHHSDLIPDEAAEWIAASDRTASTGSSSPRRRRPTRA